MARISARLEVNAWQSVRLLCAELCLTVAKREDLIAVPDQVVANGRDRRESMARLRGIWRCKWSGTRRKCYRDSSSLLTPFSPNKTKGEAHVDKA